MTKALTSDNEIHDNSTLNEISGIRFTPREIDIMCWLFNGRTSKRISTYLNISPRTTDTHLRNIMQKLECNSREGILDFIENAKETPLLKRHLTQLIYKTTFEQCLRAISLEVKKLNSSVVILYDGNDKQATHLFARYKQDFLAVGLRVFMEELNSDIRTLKQCINKMDNQSDRFVITILPRALYQEYLATVGKQYTQEILDSPKNFLIMLSTPSVKVIEPHEMKACLGKSPLYPEEYLNYYILFLNILKNLFSGLKIENLISKHEQKLLRNEGIDDQIQPRAISYKKARGKRLIISFIQDKLFLKLHKLHVMLFVCLIGIIIIVAGFKSSTKEELGTIEAVVRSDLALPAKSALLDRADILADIDEKLQGQQGIQTVALIGPGGAGKKVLARQYARQQKVPVVWEINAETLGTLLNSFENLAYVLAKTEEDKMILNGLQDNKNPNEKEEKIILFVREKLKYYPHWLLIYFNVNDFVKMQKYFPQEIGWGNGKVILTTRDTNIQNNSHVNHVVQIGEMNEQQRLDLFIKILTLGIKTTLTAQEINDAKEFLKQIPSFPLDVSVAAYYLKETQISYDKYLEYLNSHNIEFDKLQENVLKGVSNSEITRYKIITLSLNQLISAHVDFSDLLLFVSLVGSKNIPRDLLYTYKNNLIVDNFIYHLKKYSLTLYTLYDLHEEIPTFSLHMSTQAIILDFFTNTLNIQQNKVPLNSILNALESYVEDIIDKRDYPRMGLALTHCKRFMKHDHLTIGMKGRIGTKIGSIFYHMGYYAKSKQILEESFKNLNESSEKNYAALAYNMAYLGAVYKGFSEFKQAKQLLEDSLAIYKEKLPKDYAGIIQTLRYLGKVHRATGDFIKAKDALQESLVIADKHLPKNHIKKALILAYLGNVYRELGQLTKAKGAIEESLNIFKKNPGKDTFEKVEGHVYLAHVYHELGKFKDERDLLEQSLVSLKKIFGENYIRCASVLRDLANVYRELGEFEKAKSMVEKSLHIYKTHIAYDYIGVNRATYVLGLIYKDMGQYDLSIGLLKDAYAVFEKHYGTNHIVTARILRDIARSYYLKGDMEQGEIYTRQALDIFQKSEHPDIYTIYRNLSELSLKKSAKASDRRDFHHAEIYKMEAQTYLKQAIEVLKAQFPENCPILAQLEKQYKNI